MKVSVSPKAYAKVLLHACKYPHKAINGIFLAEECKHSSDLLRIVDAIPLFHQCLGLAAMLEIALSQVSAFQFSYSCIELHGLHHRDGLYQPIIFLVSYDIYG